MIEGIASNAQLANAQLANGKLSRAGKPAILVNGPAPETRLSGAQALAASPRARIEDPAATPVAANPIARFEVKTLVAEMSSKPPVNSARVEELRVQVESGSYRVDAGRLADAMINSV